MLLFYKFFSLPVLVVRLLDDCNFPSICIHSLMPQEERIARFKSFKVVIDALDKYTVTCCVSGNLVVCYVLISFQIVLL